jgi:hypothetical protein
MVQLLQDNQAFFQRTSSSAESLRTANPSVHVPKSIIGDDCRIPKASNLLDDDVSLTVDMSSTVDDREFSFDDVIVNSRAYRRALLVAQRHHSFEERGLQPSMTEDLIDLSSVVDDAATGRVSSLFGDLALLEAGSGPPSATAQCSEGRPTNAQIVDTTQKTSTNAPVEVIPNIESRGESSSEGGSFGTTNEVFGPAENTSLRSTSDSGRVLRENQTLQNAAGDTASQSLKTARLGNRPFPETLASGTIPPSPAAQRELFKIPPNPDKHAQLMWAFEVSVHMEKGWHYQPVSAGIPGLPPEPICAQGIIDYYNTDATKIIERFVTENYPEALFMQRVFTKYNSEYFHAQQTVDPCELNPHTLRAEYALALLDNRTLKAAYALALSFHFISDAKKTDAGRWRFSARAPLKVIHLYVSQYLSTLGIKLIG